MAAKPKHLNQPAQRAITDASAVGFTYWGAAGVSGFAWATDDLGCYHVARSTTRRGQRISWHACGALREKLAAEYDRLARRAWRELSPLERWDDNYRERELLRIELALKLPSWQCAEDGDPIEHPAIDPAAVGMIQIEVGQ